jgi:hypothetical protein
VLQAWAHHGVITFSLFGLEHPEGGFLRATDFVCYPCSHIVLRTLRSADAQVFLYQGAVGQHPLQHTEPAVFANRSCWWLWAWPVECTVIIQVEHITITITNKGDVGEYVVWA